MKQYLLSLSLSVLICIMTFKAFSQKIIYENYQDKDGRQLTIEKNAITGGLHFVKGLNVDIQQYGY